MPALHRYLVADLVNDRPVGYLPLGDVSYSRRVSAQGVLSGSFEITSSTAEAARFITSRPAALYALRTVPGKPTTIWWGGIIWTPRVSRESRGATTCDINAATFESLPEYRRIWTDLDLTGLDRGAVLAGLWEQMQSEGPTAEANVDTVATVVGGEPWPGSGWVGSYGITYADAIDQVVGVVGKDPAFEWTIDVYADPGGQRRRRLRIGAPLIGNPDARHLLARPAANQGWELPVDHTARGTHAVAQGAAVGKSLGGEIVPVISPVIVDANAVASGVPRVDVMDESEEVDDTLLPAKAVDALARGLVEPSATVSIPDDSGFSPANVGDTSRVQIVDPFFDGGRYDVVRRISGVTVRPAERGRPETVTIEHQTEEQK